MFQHLSAESLVEDCVEMACAQEDPNSDEALCSSIRSLLNECFDEEKGSFDVDFNKIGKKLKGKCGEWLF